jgi:hypothetical protein
MHMRNFVAVTVLVMGGLAGYFFASLGTSDYGPLDDPITRIANRDGSVDLSPDEIQWIFDCSPSARALHSHECMDSPKWLTEVIKAKGLEKARQQWGHPATESLFR